MIRNRSRSTGDPLEYPFLEIPSAGETVEVAADVFWLRMPMPGRLSHINVWLLRDHDGWTIVDTGINTEDLKKCWEGVFEKHLQNLPVKRVFSTHLHGDHTGLSGWITQRWNAELWMSRTDFLMCKVMAAYGPRDVPDEAIRFYRRAGFSTERLDEYRGVFGKFGSSISTLPQGYRRVIDGDYIDIGGREWRVVIGRGHSPEHVCLYCPELKVLISGDQILPKITPNVSVNPSEPRANPLKEWLASSAELRDFLPGDLLVLPAHEDLFHGVHERLTQIIAFHETGLEKLYDLCAEPKRAVDVFPALFKSEIDRFTFFAATGESIAHLHCALDRRMLVEEEDYEGVAWYRQA
ncbi:MAG: MBL fold metallo-hydrolase [bacterium]|nr:MBL fold metallo-hydrolase [Deltaproteobacteria bacterium]MCP4907669.1 MBL fold metallo-hydrolase [bacterium]